MSIYQFIDGEFLQTEIRSARQIFKIPDAIPFDYAKLARPYTRSFYYDAYPSKKDNQTELEHEADRKRAEELFKLIASQPNMHVRNGFSKYQKSRKVTVQKGVDILLALDLFRHAVRGGIEAVVLIASDLDFTPVLDALIDTSVRSYLCCNPKKTNVLLMEAADVVEPFNEYNVLQHMPDSVSRPFVVGQASYGDIVHSMSQLPVVAEVDVNGSLFKVHRDKGQLVGWLEGRDNTAIVGSDIRSIKLFAEGRYRIALDGLPIPNDCLVPL